MTGLLRLLRSQEDDIKGGNTFMPDRSAVWTAEKAESELKDFKFNGTGWYIGKTDTMLVLPCGNSEKGEKEGEKEVYRFCVYNGRNPVNAFTWVIRAPVRLDER
jgi:hypothetical protein